MPEAEDSLESHHPGTGFPVVRKKLGTLNFATYVTFRYLNQMGLDSSYTDSFGRRSRVQQRNDLQMQKVMLYFSGWIVDPRFRYLLYVWTSNTNIGQTTQVVVAGNLQYKINKYFDIGGGVAGLPGTRTMVGSWPLWLRQDARPMAEEYFRGGFTTGIWSQGELAKGFYYKTAIGNNLNQFGIDAGQLDNKFQTWGASLWWTTKNYGRLQSSGDFEDHQNVATVLGGGYTKSRETRQSQPSSDAPENTQIRLSDGTGLFSLNAFDNGSQVLEATYQMASFNGGVKYKGLSLDFQYYMRWLHRFKSLGELPVTRLFDNGFSIEASGMLIPKVLQLYSIGSYVDGQYGKPWEINAGINWYVLKSRILRLNGEVVWTRNSPVGNLTYPTSIGANGTAFMVNLELYY